MPIYFEEKPGVVTRQHPRPEPAPPTPPSNPFIVNTITAAVAWMIAAICLAPLGWVLVHVWAWAIR